jgi:hypothetical protein
LIIEIKFGGKSEVAEALEEGVTIMHDHRAYNFN